MILLNEYDIGKAFKRIEDELIKSMIRNLDHHRAEEDKEGFRWSQWQVEQLQAMEEYKKANKKKFSEEFAEINSSIEDMIKMARKEGNLDQEAEILKAIKDGAKLRKGKGDVIAEFFKVNDRKLDALIKATTDDFKRGEVAILRMANDQYRKIIFDAQVYANAGGTTYEKAVDMATKDFISKGINCIEYKNGSRHSMEEYADMAIRTACKRAYLTGEGEKRKEWGISTVIVNKRGNPCPKCLPFCGKVLIDDVWSDGPKDGKSPETGITYPLMSKAIEAGLYHPRCRDSHTTYFEGISDPPDGKYRKEEIEDISRKYQKEQREKYEKKQQEKYERLEECSLDKENKRRYAIKKQQFEKNTDVDKSILELKKQFSELTEGYSYDDFMKDFDSIEDGFEGASDVEMKKAKKISEQIKSLIQQLEGKSDSVKNDPVAELVKFGIKLEDKTSGGISDEILSKYAEFVKNFEDQHKVYFEKNKVHLKSISIVDKVKVKGGEASGIYRDGLNVIEVKKSSIRKKQSSFLSKSDDFEIHALAHEYGHYISDTLEKSFGISWKDAVQNAMLKYFDGDIWKASVKNLIEPLSPYGSGSYGEAFAEAFAEAYTCENPGKFARIFKEELEKLLKST